MLQLVIIIYANRGVLFFCKVLVEIIPVKYVDRKINKKGSHVPRKLLNISRLLSMTRAITKKSMKITNEVKIIAVNTGLANLKFLK